MLDVFLATNTKFPLTDQDVAFATQEQLHQTIRATAQRVQPELSLKTVIFAIPALRALCLAREKLRVICVPVVPNPTKTKQIVSPALQEPSRRTATLFASLVHSTRLVLVLVHVPVIRVE